MKSKGFVFIETIVVIVILSLGLVMVYEAFATVLANNKRRATYNDVAYLYRTYYIEDFISSLNIEDYIDYYLGDVVTVDGTPTGKVVHGGKKIQVFDCHNPILYNIDINVQSSVLPTTLSDTEQKKLLFCEKIMRDYKVRTVYITHYNVSDLKRCTTRAGKTSNSGECKMSDANNKLKYDALNTMSPSMIYYLRTLTGTDPDTYRVIVEFEEKVLDSDSTITKIKASKSDTPHCPNGYKDAIVKDKNGNNQSVCQREVTKRYYSNVALIKKK